MNATTPFLYLASQSPRRSQLLTQLGVRHEVLLPNVAGDVHEDAEALEVSLPDEDPAQYVQRVTALKLGAARERWQRRCLPAAPILCADTTVALHGQILGKPDSPEHARAMLKALANTVHQVHTAISLYCPPALNSTASTSASASAQIWHALSSSDVHFTALSDEQIQSYVDSTEPMGKAGAYAVQGRAAAWIAHISGSYSGIMGLPLFETAQLLRRAGWML